MTEIRGRRSRRRIPMLSIGATVALIVAAVAAANLVRSNDPVTPVPVVTTVLGRLPSTTEPGIVGEAAPDFSVDLAGGGRFTLSRHILDDGRPVLLNLWASWCFPCREEMPALDSASREHSEVAFVGVAIRNSESDALGFLEQVPVSYPVGVDDGSVDDAYRPLAMPESYLISSDGVIVKRLFGGLTEQRISEELDGAFG